MYSKAVYSSNYGDAAWQNKLLAEQRLEQQSAELSNNTNPRKPAFLMIRLRKNWWGRLFDF